MAKARTAKEPESRLSFQVHRALREGALWLFGALALILRFALFTYDSTDPGFNQVTSDNEVSKGVGRVDAVEDRRVERGLITQRNLIIIAVGGDAGIDQLIHRLRQAGHNSGDVRAQLAGDVADVGLPLENAGADLAVGVSGGGGVRGNLGLDLVVIVDEGLDLGLDLGGKPIVSIRFDIDVSVK